MNTYDELPYQCQFRAEMHPAHLASIGTLRGLPEPSLETMRVLELGCADGTHSIALALAFPDATFVGVDTSARQIKAGQTNASNLDLNNIELRQYDILDIDDSWGQFDFVLSHGVYSWVPPETQAKVLEISRARLTEHGIAYVSYNTRPGWNMRSIIRDMLLYHTQQFDDIETKLSQLHSWLEFTYEHVKDSDEPYDSYLREELEVLRNMPDTYLFHDLLEQDNDPVYLHEFVRDAEKHQLQYLGESMLPLMFREFDATDIEELLGMELTMTYREQYLDFLDNCYFRRTLLCHEHLELSEPEFTLETIKNFHFSSNLAPKATLDLTIDKSEEFESSMAIISENMPASKAALEYLYDQWPQSVNFQDLYEHAADMIVQDNDNPEDQERWLNPHHVMITLNTCYLKRRYSDLDSACPTHAFCQ